EHYRRALDAPRSDGGNPLLGLAPRLRRHPRGVVLVAPTVEVQEERIGSARRPAGLADARERVDENARRARLLAASDFFEIDHGDSFGSQCSESSRTISCASRTGSDASSALIAILAISNLRVLRSFLFLMIRPTSPPPPPHPSCRRAETFSKPPPSPGSPIPSAILSRPR